MANTQPMPSQTKVDVGTEFFLESVVITLVPPVAVLMRLVVVELLYGVEGIGVAG